MTGAQEPTPPSNSEQCLTCTRRIGSVAWLDPRGTGCTPSLPTHPSQIPASSHARLFGSSLLDQYAEYMIGHTKVLRSTMIEWHLLSHKPFTEEGLAR